LIKENYVEALILIAPNWVLEFYIHMNAMIVMPTQNTIEKCDQLISYASQSI
jgi:hypothetical protein